MWQCGNKQLTKSTEAVQERVARRLLGASAWDCSNGYCMRGTSIGWRKLKKEEKKRSY